MASRPRSIFNGSAIAVAVGLLVVVVAFATYLTQMQRREAAQVERQRRATCALLAVSPRNAFPGLAGMRAAFARPGHPHDCLPARRTAPRATASPAPATTHVVTTPGPTATTTARTRTRQPTARLTPSFSPSPSPSPTPTCVLFICVP